MLVCGHFGTIVMSPVCVVAPTTSTLASIVGNDHLLHGFEPRILTFLLEEM